MKICIPFCFPSQCGSFQNVLGFHDNDDDNDNDADNDDNIIIK